MARRRMVGWGMRDLVIFYGSGLGAAIAGQSAMHAYLKPNEELPKVERHWHEPTFTVEELVEQQQQRATNEHDTTAGANAQLDDFRVRTLPRPPGVTDQK